MKCLILHLSDIHIKGQTDPVLARGGRVVEAVRGISSELHRCIIVVSGDIAFSGTDEQYGLASELLTTIRDRLRGELRPAVPVELVLIPGNHDCDFRSSGDIRDILVAKAALNDGMSVADDVAEVCTEVQGQFFSLRSAIASNALKGDNPLYWEYRFATEDESFLFRCCNTAWMSVKGEQPGRMIFPVARIPDQEAKADLAITIFHHPYNWFVPLNGREFRKRIEEVSDIILTGHEHDITLRTQRAGRGEVNTYVEGGALQENHDPNVSQFNAIVIDTELKRQKVFHFGWDGTLYAAAPQDPSWQEYQVNRLRSAGDVAVSDKTAAFLADLGISISHPARGLLSLQDIFVYPDLKEVIYRPRDRAKSLRGESLIELVSRAERLLITAADKAGKTTLGKKLFRDYLASGFIPLYLDGTSGKFHADDRAVTELTKQFASQYVSMGAEWYRQLDRSRRVLIVDNFDAIRPTKASLRGIVGQLTHFAGHVILLANDVAQQVAEITGNSPTTEGELAFTHYRIQPFGHLRRNELIERWFALDEGAADNQDDLARRVLHAKHTMDTAIGRNFVPSYPIMLLPILQALQHNEQINTNASTYGYFYELLIRRTLASGSSSVALDVKLGYLTFLARAMFVGKKARLTEQELREVHSAYEQHHLLPVSFRDLIGALVRTQVLDDRRGEYSFKYSYTYYYFVASYLRDNLSDAEVQSMVGDLARRLHEEDNANILLFLAHLSKDRFIVSQMMQTAAAMFSDVPRAELRPDSSPLLKLDTESPSVYTERDSREHRRELLTEIDQYEAKVQATQKNPSEAVVPDGRKAPSETREAIDQVISEATTYIERIGVAFRTLQILGQLLKNFVGTMDGDTKRALADECVALGLRSLGSMFRLVEERGSEYIDSLIDALRQEDPDTSDRELTERATQSLSGLVTLASYGMVKRISHSIGSPYLEKVYDLIRERDDSPAVGLVHASLKLDQFADFPNDEVRTLYDALHGNALAIQVLRSLVVNHFHLFDLRFDLKQSVCAAIGIEYRPSLGNNPRVKLITS